MRNMIPVLAITWLACSAPASESDPATADALTGRSVPQEQVLSIIPIQHSAMALEFGDLTILVDPHGDPAWYNEHSAPDLVLITDIHGDHLDTATLGALDLATADLVTPQAVYDLLPRELQDRTTVMDNGARVDLRGVNIEAIPMYNMPDLNDPRHPKGRGNGYVLTFGGQRIYISGDTEDIPEMRALTDIDIAFVCMNLPYTMTVEKAADAVLSFRPNMVYPYHYRGQDGFSDVALFKKMVNEGDPSIQVRQENWYPE